MDLHATVSHEKTDQVLSFSRSYSGKNYPIRFWRTKTGLEVDFVLGEQQPVAIEVTISERVDRSDTHGLFAFSQEVDASRLILVCLEPRRRKIEAAGTLGIEIIPWREFLAELWQQEIL